MLKTIAEAVASPGCQFLEIGSWCGDSTVILGEVARKHGGKVFCIDWWKGSETTELQGLASRRDVYGAFWSRMCHAGLDNTVIPIRGRSEAVGEVLAEGVLDLVFIDGDHRYEGTQSDIRQYRPLVRTGGMLCGHDCEGYLDDFDIEFLKEHRDVDAFEFVHCGTILAVNEAFSNFSIDHSIWSVRSGTDGSWEPTRLDFPGIPNRKQLPPPPIAASKSYEIVRFGKLVYAVPVSMGSYDLACKRIRTNSKVVSARSVAELEERIGEKFTFAFAPVLVDTHMDASIVQYGGKFYGITLAAGPVDLSRISDSQLTELIDKNLCVIGDTIDGTKLLIHQAYLDLDLTGQQNALKLAYALAKSREINEELSRELADIRSSKFYRFRAWLREHGI